MTLKVYTVRESGERSKPRDVPVSLKENSAPLIDSQWPLCECISCRTTGMVVEHGVVPFRT